MPDPSPWPWTWPQQARTQTHKHYMQIHLCTKKCMHNVTHIQNEAHCEQWLPEAEAVCMLLWPQPHKIITQILINI